MVFGSIMTTSILDYPIVSTQLGFDITSTFASVFGAVFGILPAGMPVDQRKLDLSGQYVSLAYSRFFSEPSIPQLSWFLSFEFATPLLAHFALAFVIDIMVVIQNILPKCGDEPGGSSIHAA